jgi:hypothetical protein
MKLFELSSQKQIVYHGSPGPVTGQLRPPIFVAENPVFATFYALDRRSYRDDSKGVIVKGSLNNVQALDTRSKMGYSKYLKIAKAAGIQYVLNSDRAYFVCPEIKKYSKYEGENPFDMVYIPSFVKALKAEGYNAIRMREAHNQDDLEGYILLDRNLFKTISKKPVIDYL